MINQIAIIYLANKNKKNFIFQRTYLSISNKVIDYTFDSLIGDSLIGENANWERFRAFICFALKIFRNDSLIEDKIIGDWRKKLQCLGTVYLFFASLIGEKDIIQNF